MTSAMVFTGSGIAAYQALAIAKALELKARSNIRVNSAYTPTKMMQMARKLTGQKFAARDYLGAAAALRAHAETLK